MDIIHLLPDSVANQIAAGEVIQRPASVVKELVENAIDAGATHIQIHIVDAGKTMIQVIDNGKGMSETDARMAFERHATSKIRTAEDLFTLQTMGFRGEALPSIAAVAQVELRTRLEGSDCGTCIQIEGSKVTGSEVVMCPQGANFMVKNLFFNIPARRKFLKSNQTELNNILQEFERITLAHPDLAFTLHHGDSQLYNLPPQTFHRRIIDLFGKRYEKILIPVSVETTLVSATGFVGLPSSAKKKGVSQFFLTNGRYMRHPYFAKGIMTAYDRLIAEGDQVPFFINLTVDPAKLDVNVHPQKTEIKFEDDAAIFQILQAAVRETLGRHNAVPSIDFDTENRPDFPGLEALGNADASPFFTAPTIEVDDSFNPFNSASSASSTERPERSWSAPTSAPKEWKSLYDTLIPAQEEVENEATETQTSLLSVLGLDSEGPWAKGCKEVLQVRGRYVIAQTHNGLLIVDQHRAHVRILYEQYMKQFATERSVSQYLLLPLLVQLSPKEVATLSLIEGELEDVGFEISPLGDGDYSILAVPAGTENAHPEQMLVELLNSDITTENLRERITHVIANVLSQRSAIAYGQYLSQEECTDLLDSLFDLSNSTFTPTGQRIFAVMTDGELGRTFG
jgi:DNA mismatch repair protein MutL